MSAGVVALLLGLGMAGCIKARAIWAAAIVGSLFGFVLAFTPLGSPVWEALGSLGESLFDLLTGRGR